MKKYWRTNFWYNFAKSVAAYPIIKKFNFHSAKYDIKPPFLLLCNHTTDYDAIFIASSFSTPLHFVMSDHVSAKYSVGKLIHHLVGTIPITKSTKDVACVRQILNVAKHDGAVAIFPEGNKSHVGSMSYIKPSIAKLVKLLNIPLVLYTIDGGYFSSPRWTKNKRKGFIQGKIQKIVVPEDYNKMSNDELYKIIVDGISVDAYKVQNVKHIEYNGKNLAENIESVVYVCPKCKSFGTLQGYHDQIRCKNCDFLAEIDNFGYISGPIRQLDEWDKFQKNELSKIDFDSDKLIFEDKNCLLEQKVDNYKNKKIGTFDISLKQKSIELKPNKKGSKQIVIPFNQIENCALEGINGLQICMKDGRVYRINSKPSMNAKKYIDSLCLVNNW